MAPEDPRRRLHAKFRATSLERIERLNNALLALENDPDDAARIEAVMREVHTIKGEARMLALETVNRTAHAAEDALCWARDHRFRVPQEGFDLIYEGLDRLGELVSTLPNAIPADRTARGEAFVDQVRAFLAEPPAAAPAPEHESESEAPAPPTPGPADAEGAGAQPAVLEVDFLRVPMARINRLIHLTGSLILRENDVEKIGRDMERLVGDWQRAIDAARIKLAHSEGGAAEALSGDGGLARFAALGKEMAVRVARLRDHTFFNDLRLHELQETIGATRLLDVADLLGQYPRVIRDLAREQGKQLRVTVECLNVRADKQVLDRIGDPLLHLIRNSVDHGLEGPEERLAAGKPERGTVALRARQREGLVEIEVADDGRGIDRAVVEAALVRLGWAGAAEAAALEDDRLLQHLFRPGFSTREAVTDLSGRGVGLDVVKQTVEELGGSVAIRSEPGRGTTFALHFPVSVALTNVLLVRSSTGLFAFPTTAVETVLHVRPGDLEAAGEGQSFRLEDDTAVALTSLTEVLGLGAESTGQEALFPVVLLRSEGRRLGVRVWKVVGERQVVQQSLNDFVSGLRIATGTGVVQGGELVTFLNVVRLVGLAEEARVRRAAGELPSAPAGGDIKRVLVVEDSDLTREMLVSTVGKLGYRVSEAVNGRDALAKMATTAPDLILTDLDMPVLDGFGLIREVRRDRRLKDVPIVVLSTRDGPETKRKAAQVGADAYVVKSAFNEDELLTTFEQLLNSVRS